MPQASSGLHLWPIMTLPSTFEVVSRILRQMLSRIKWQHDDAVVVKAILVRGLNADTAIPQPFEQNTIKCHNINFAGAPEISKEDWVKEQDADEDISPVVKLVR